MNTQQLISCLKYVGSDQDKVRSDIWVNGQKKSFKHLCPTIGAWRELLQVCADHRWIGMLYLEHAQLNVGNGDVCFNGRTPLYNALASQPIPVSTPERSDTKADKTQSDINVSIPPPEGPKIQAERNKTVAALLKMVAEYEGPKITISALAPTVSDILDSTFDTPLRAQVFKAAGIHAPAYEAARDFVQPWKDKLAKLLTVKDGCTFYVAGRTRSADGTLYYAPSGAATCYLLMVTDSKGDACRSKGCYNRIQDVGEVIWWMCQFSQVENFGGINYDAEHVYPGCVP